MVITDARTVYLVLAAWLCIRRTGQHNIRLFDDMHVRIDTQTIGQTADTRWQRLAGGGMLRSRYSLWLRCFRLTRNDTHRSMGVSIKGLVPRITILGL